MGKPAIDISELYKDNRILVFLLSRSKSFYKKIFFISLLFYLLPLCALLLCITEGIIFIPGKAVGMLEDYLYMTYILIIAPLLLLLLYNVMLKYRLFLEDVPSFCKFEAESELQIINKDNLSAIQKPKPLQKTIQYILGMLAFASNTSSIIKREGGWDSLDYPLIFIIVALHLFVVIGFVLPTIIMRFISLVNYQIRLTKTLVRRDLLSIKPLSPDGAGGLRSLGKLSLSYTYMLIPFIISLGVQYISWDYLTLGFYMGLFGFLPLSVFVFFFPLSVVHRAMDDTKRNIMKKLSYKYDQLNNKLLEKMNEENWEEVLIRKNKVLEIIDKMYSVAEKMPVWPFNLKILSHFLAITFGPLLLILLEFFIQEILSKFIY